MTLGAFAVWMSLAAVGGWWAGVSVGVKRGENRERVRWMGFVQETIRSLTDEEWPESLTIPSVVHLIARIREYGRGGWS